MTKYIFKFVFPRRILIGLFLSMQIKFWSRRSIIISILNLYDLSRQRINILRSNDLKSCRKNTSKKFIVFLNNECPLLNGSSGISYYLPTEFRSTTIVIQSSIWVPKVTLGLKKVMLELLDSFRSLYKIYLSTKTY